MIPQERNPDSKPGRTADGPSSLSPWEKRNPDLSRLSTFTEALDAILETNRGVVLGDIHNDHTVRTSLRDFLLNSKLQLKDRLNIYIEGLPPVLNSRSDAFRNRTTDEIFSPTIWEQTSPGLCELENDIARAARDQGIMMTIVDVNAGFSKRQRKNLRENFSTEMHSIREERDKFVEEDWSRAIAEKELAKPENCRFIFFTGLYHAPAVSNRIGVPSASPNMQRYNKHEGLFKRHVDCKLPVVIIHQPMAYINLKDKFPRDSPSQDALKRISKTKQGYSWFAILESMSDEQIKKSLDFLSTFKEEEIKEALSAVSEKKILDFLHELSKLTPQQLSSKNETLELLSTKYMDDPLLRHNRILEISSREDISVSQISEILKMVPNIEAEFPESEILKRILGQKKLENGHLSEAITISDSLGNEKRRVTLIAITEAATRLNMPDFFDQVTQKSPLHKKVGEEVLWDPSTSNPVQGLMVPEASSCAKPQKAQNIPLPKESDLDKVGQSRSSLPLTQVRTPQTPAGATEQSRLLAPMPDGRIRRLVMAVRKAANNPKDSIKKAFGLGR